VRRAALTGNLSRDEYESNNSFLAFAHEILDLELGSLQGITGPLQRPGTGSDLVRMTDLATRRYRALRTQLLERPYASFWSGGTDAPREWAGTGIAQRPVVLLYSVCCTDPQPTG
jgi:hypothetical protein